MLTHGHVERSNLDSNEMFELTIHSTQKRSSRRSLSLSFANDRYNLWWARALLHLVKSSQSLAYTRGALPIAGGEWSDRLRRKKPGEFKNGQINIFFLSSIWLVRTLNTLLEWYCEFSNEFFAAAAQFIHPSDFAWPERKTLNENSLYSHDDDVREQRVIVGLQPSSECERRYKYTTEDGGSRSSHGWKS